ncbi:twin-arginine translocase subunit TatC [Halegenticoccus tardaugens]|uniref:twin-arginine translocase subunit TatC n=1 Tax=Halegenticoccus tardaugens TaxID=2071624 RepID=UPI00100C1F50|nr:twin-arginine translocase subunit TatC [Halegenticoccus tardaugens]
MSSALDEDTRRALDEGRQTAGAMLRAAQKDLQKVFIVFLLGFFGAFYALQLYVWDFLKRVTMARMEPAVRDGVNIIAQTPFDVILLQAKISLAVGIIVALPAFVYFARDALKDRGRWPDAPIKLWKVFLVGSLSLVLFVGGLFYGYYLFFPLMFEFLAQNALSAGFEASYSIVMWAEFIFFLTLSFGLAAQMPLAITGLSYSGVVRYETFRDKWRHAVLAIFVFGAVFSPPDPFTQIMWAVPLLVLYGFSLYLAKVVVTAKRGSERVSLARTARRRWNVLAGGVGVGAAAVYLFYERGGVEAANGLLARFGDYRVLPVEAVLPLPSDATLALLCGVAGLLVAVVALLYFVAVELGEDGAASGGDDGGRVGDPTAIDVGGLDADGVRAAPSEPFAAMTEEEALRLASAAIDEGDHAKAQAILDRYDGAHEGEAHEGDAAAEGEGAGSPAAAAGASATTSAGTAASAGMREPTGVLDSVRRGFGWVSWRDRFRATWNVLAGVGALVGVGAYYVLSTPYARYVQQYGNEAVPYVPAAYRGRAVAALADLQGGLGDESAALVAVGLALAVVALFAAVLALSAAWQAGRDPAARDVRALTTAEVRGAPPRLFAETSESEALGHADRELRAGNEEKAQAILDRYDEVQAAMEARAEPEPGSVGDRASRAGGTFLDELTDGETDEDDIGGYYKDITFILDSITSRTFRLIAVFMLVLGGTFTWLYAGGLGAVFANFLSRLPADVRPESLRVVALHPVEALIFEVKFSTLVAVLVTLPIVGYYAWPALRERGFVRGHQRVIFGWVAALGLGLFGGFALGYAYVAPAVISYLVADAARADMVISYRITKFFWLIFYTTAGIGLLADVPVLMVLFNTAGVPYRAMRDRWREVTVAILTFAAVFTPAGIITMFLVTIPLMVAYGVGLAVLFVLTLGGRRDLAPSRGAEV